MVFELKSLISSEIHFKTEDTNKKIISYHYPHIEDFSEAVIM